jgi:DNA repair protein RecN (Recombination protein N)
MLLQIVGQHASPALLSTEAHRILLDRYGDLTEQAAAFQIIWQNVCVLKRQLHELQQSERERVRSCDTLQRELVELEEAQLQPGEEEELFAEYTRLMNAETLATLTYELTDLLESDQKGILATLARGQRLFDKLLNLDISLQEAAALWHNAAVELAETVHLLHHYDRKLSADPARAAHLNARLQLITQLKRKYGPDIQTICSYQARAKERLQQLELCDETIAQLQQQLDTSSAKLDKASHDLTNARQQAATSLAQALTTELRTLNMPHVEVDIAVTQKHRCQHGDDDVEIFISPNPGEKKVPLRQSASGGEIARTLLALQYLLAGKGGVPTLIFDEVDANIGGQTATLIGNKLQAIGAQHQVLCVTHFPQVAIQAHHHLLIAKNEQQGRTLTTITPLSTKQKKPELARMAGQG